MYTNELDALKRENDAVVLAHYYVDAEVQAAADFIGDSFFLAKKATTIPQSTIVMAGVNFMGETMKILNPDKTVYLPDAEADCPMAHMVTVDAIRAMRDKYDDLAVLCYVNSTAEIKAHSDYCCTSSNAEKIVASVPETHIFFVPDQNLGQYIAAKFPEKQFHFHEGFCPVHHRIRAEQIAQLKKNHPDAAIFAHPECRPEVLVLADYKGSTSGILDAVGERDRAVNIIVTEGGIAAELEKRYPEKTFVFPEMLCEGMKRVNLKGIIRALREGGDGIAIDPELARRAKRPLDRMLEITAK